MKSLPVGELKAHFSEVLEDVKNGETVEIVYGKKRTPVAKLVPIENKQKAAKRKLGAWEGKVKVTFASDFKMTDEEFINQR